MKVDSKPIFFPPVESEYMRCFCGLKNTGVLALLPQTKTLGIIGIDGIEYPVPSQAQVVKLIEVNGELVRKKYPQGFNRLELTPMAMPLPTLFNRLRIAITKHASEKKIYQTKHSPTEPLMPVRVNSEKQVWVWEKLDQAIGNDELIYFPQEYSANHRGKTKLEAILDGNICALPGWSVGLVEGSPIMPGQGKGNVIGGRQQLEVGNSPSEYLQALRTEFYQGETGKTIEDFIVKFLYHLNETNQVSNDRNDSNALWCLGQYLKIEYAELVPTGWWHRNFGRVRLDLHRTGNKLCTRNWGCFTTVRLLGNEK